MWAIHAAALSIVAKLPMVGCYVYADYITGRIWALKYDEKAKKVVANYSIACEQTPPVIAFGEDEQQEVYFTDSFGQFWTFVKQP
jgi:quinoprotein glucose dehydrogenase